MLRTTKRLKKEIDFLKERYLLLDEDLIEFNNYFHLVIKPIENNKKYLIEMDKSTFPFKPPNIFLLTTNDNAKTNYIYFFKKSFLFYETKLDIQNNNCVCCYNLHCNWTLGTNIYKLIDESEDFYLQLKTYREQYFGMKSLKQFININNINILDVLNIIEDYLKWI